MAATQTHGYAAEKVSARIKELPTLDRSALVKIWNEVFPSPPLPSIRKQLMVPVLAHRIQEMAFGGLSHTARKRLDDLVASNRDTPSRPGKSAKAPAAKAKLIRGWGGEVHEVLVVDSGFIYRGKTFKSLSPIARKITGTQWSGPAFFGTRAKDRK